jgi:hypothetical protein
MNTPQMAVASDLQTQCTFRCAAVNEYRADFGSVLLLPLIFLAIKRDVLMRSFVRVSNHKRGNKWGNN